MDKYSRVEKIFEKTIVGSKKRYCCKCCANVIEVLGGFCEKNNVKPGDPVALSAVSYVDKEELEKEAMAYDGEREFVSYKDNVYYGEYSAPLRIITYIADVL